MEQAVQLTLFQLRGIGFIRFGNSRLGWFLSFSIQAQGSCRGSLHTKLATVVTEARMEVKKKQRLP